MAGQGTWGEIAEGYRLHLVEANKSPETIKTYMTYAGMASVWFQTRHLEVTCADRAQMGRFVEATRKTHKPNTVRNFINALRSVYRYLMAEGSREDDPTARYSTKKPDVEAVPPLTQDEKLAMYSQATAPVDRAMLMLFIGSPIRIGELVKIEVPDIDWRNEEIVLYGKGGHPRFLALTPFMARSLREYVGDRTSGALFLNGYGLPMSRERARVRIKAAAARAGVNRVFPHRFRSTFIGNALEDGADPGAVQTMAGHKDLEQTLYYARYSQQRRAMKAQRRLGYADMLALPEGKIKALPAV